LQLGKTPKSSCVGLAPTYIFFLRAVEWPDYYRNPCICNRWPFSSARGSGASADMYDEDVRNESSADDSEEGEEPPQRRRAVTTPSVLTLADAGPPGDVYRPVTLLGTGQWSVTEIAPLLHSQGTSGMRPAARGQESTCPPPPSPPPPPHPLSHCSIHTPSYAQAAVIAVATMPVNPRLSCVCPLNTEYCPSEPNRHGNEQRTHEL